MFSYHSDRLDETQNNLVLAFNELVSDFRDGKSETSDYKEKNATFAESIVKYCVEATGREFTGMDQVKNPQIVTVDQRFGLAFATILAEAITPAVPAIISSEYTRLYDVHQVGWGR